MSLISPALKGYMKLRNSAIDNFMLNPIDTQKQVFNHILGSAQFTEYGKKYGFEHINSISSLVTSSCAAKKPSEALYVSTYLI